jgi:D-alanyl-lipoteichoic acid acyltransferase DltB (MBOAT superfamily)
LSLLIISSLLNYQLGIQISEAKDEKRQNFLTTLGVVFGVGLLFYFKYLNFFIGSISNLCSVLGFKISVHTLNIMLPLGLSFYTFKTISYLLDVNAEKIKPIKDWIVFFNYVSFFPTIVAGPIDRATSFAPQLEKNRVFEYENASRGLRQILWGFFKKLVIADNCVEITNNLFDNYLKLPGSSLVFGAFIYIIEIYADFSGYSDMAIGFSRLLGFNVTKNFNFPFFSQNTSEFWRKWHISLTSWMTEYVYTPLTFAFRSRGKLGLIIAIIINFVLVGLWHGASANFILFGFLHGCYFIPLVINGTINKKPSQLTDDFFSKSKRFVNRFATFLLVMFTAMILRANSITETFHYYHKLFSKSLFSIPVIPTQHPKSLIAVVLFIAIMFILEWYGRNTDFALETFGTKWPKFIRWGFYIIFVMIIFAFTAKSQQFVYAQF